jgi:hypothetical protein
MRKYRTTIVIIGAICALAFAAAATPASAQIAFLSNTGSGTACTQAAPCVSMNDAISVAGASGEVICLNKGYYSFDVTISQSVTISCGEGWWESPDGIVTITTPADTDEVVIEGLVLDEIGTVGPGISMTGQGVLDLRHVRIGNSVATNSHGLNFIPSGPAVLHVTDSVFYNNGGSGVLIQPSSGACAAYVTNTVIHANGSGGGLNGGIYIVPAAGATAKVSISNSQINGNYYGIIGDGRQDGVIHAAIKDSVVSGNTDNGITVLSSGTSVVFTIDQTEVLGNLAGLYAGGSNAGILARNTTVFENTIGLDTSGGGALYTYGNNSVNGNVTNGAFTGTAGLQ